MSHVVTGGRQSGDTAKHRRVKTRVGTYIIRGDIPIPDLGECNRIYPFADLAPGGCFETVHSPREAKRIRDAGKKWTQRHEFIPRFRVLVVKENGRKIVRCWRLPDPNAQPDAQQEPETVEVEEQTGPVSY